jgi:hypothetical protein
VVDIPGNWTAFCGLCTLKDSGSIYEKGLIDSITEKEFDRSVISLKATWDCRQPGFHSWFVKFEAELFKRHLIACVTKLARIDKHYCTNQVEYFFNL